MSLGERNVFLASMWQELTEEEREEFNRRALTEEVVPQKTLIKRTLKRVKREVNDDTSITCESSVHFQNFKAII